MSHTAGIRYDDAELRHFTQTLFTAAGVDAGPARAIADILVDADMMGHSTHGLALVQMYLNGLKNGAMAPHGEIEVVRDFKACVTWNGNRLPGAWLLTRALDIAIERAAEIGTCTFAITNSYHVGALAPYLKRATERGMMVILASSTASVSGVAPFGGLRGVMTPNPYAAGIPTDGDPILLDISASITTRNKAIQYAEAGKRFPHPWAIDAQGQPTDDPNVIVSGEGVLLPTGGLDHGHKGYSLGLLVEALTQGFAGAGRADHVTGTYTGLFLQVLSPEAFAGLPAFERQTGWLANACRNTPPLPGVERVRLPGEGAMTTFRDARANGVRLDEDVVRKLEGFASQHAIAAPRHKEAATAAQ